ncbi:chaperonin 10-like protein [Mycena rosella]|uniref:Chaperonin 10-like protein n=1 Tax=Mycena rosella TaxID=1033263 RepID=A0AAD7D492_MYCRO|nr:chaperonin 10-like protein [Mycena rosella]
MLRRILVCTAFSACLYFLLLYKSTLLHTPLVTTKMMRAVVVHGPGGPDALVLEQRPIPVPQSGQILIRVHAFGLNRAEMFTRQGHSPGVTFPRILGIEATGVVAAAPGGEFPEGAAVATVMGGMGRLFDGSYAEYTVVPAAQVKVVNASVGWEIMGALPEMMQTAWGALFISLQLKAGETLLVRGGSSSVGMAAAALARHHGVHVVSTTRNESRRELLLASGAHDVLIDAGSIADEARKRYPDGFDKVLELVGVTTLADSLKIAKRGGVVCTAGIVGGKWVLDEFTPNAMIPTGVYLTTYSSSVAAFMETPLDEIARLVDNGTLRIPIKSYRLDQIVAAHGAMDESTACAKMVVLIE